MHCSHCRPHILCGLAVVLLSGCQWYYPYGYPGTYAAPGTMMPQQTFPGAPPATLQPSPPLAPGGNSTFQSPATPGGNSAPLWNPNSSPGTSTNEKPVPNPIAPFGDPNSLGGQGASNSDDENFTPFESMSGEREEFAGVEHADGSSAGIDGFQEPLPLDPEAAHRAPNGAEIPYGYDKAGYTWLNGRVDYNEEDNSWHIVYDPRPSVQDKLGGAVRLVYDERLNKLQDGDVVQIKGELDYDHPDPLGKAQYRVDKLGRLLPSGSKPVAN